MNTPQPRSFTDDEMEEISKNVQSMAHDRALEHIKKHKKEIERLNSVAEEGILTQNFEKYFYAITKLKVLYKQPAMTKNQIKDLYDTSIEAVKSIVNSQKII